MTPQAAACDVAEVDWDAFASAAEEEEAPEDDQPQPRSGGAARFNASLVQRFGSTLAAWREALDVGGHGRVPYIEFCRACRRLGMAQPGSIWSQLKGETKSSPLEFRDLDPVEGKNVADLCQALWTEFGGDLSRAWLELDAGGKNWASWEEFSAGVGRWGFNGDFRAVYRGLSEPGRRRLNRSAFLYLGVLSPISGKRRPPGSVLDDLASWVQRQFGGAATFIQHLRMEEGCTELPVGDLAAQLVALGFAGDAMEAASKAARTDLGVAVSMKGLNIAIAGGRTLVDGGARRPASAPKSRRGISVEGAAQRGGSPQGRTGQPRIPLNHPEWSTNLDDIGCRNAVRCRYDRRYFGAAPKRVLNV